MAAPLKPKAKAKRTLTKKPVEVQDSVQPEQSQEVDTLKGKPTPSDFLASEGLIFYGTPIPMNEDQLCELLSKYSDL